MSLIDTDRGELTPAADRHDTLPPPVSYRLNPARVTMRELWMENRTPVVLLAWVVLKCGGKHVPASTDDLPVESLAPYLVDEQALPAEVREQFDRGAAELAALGFHDPAYHAVPDPLHRTDTYLATFAHRSRPAAARLHIRLWGIKTPPKPKSFAEFFTEFDGGTYLWSLSGKPDMLAPKSCTLVRREKAATADLWREHERALAATATPGRPTPVPGADAALAVAERLHAQVRDFHLARGVFVAATAADFERMGGARRAAPGPAVPGASHAAVLAEVERLQRSKSGRLGPLLVLVVSAALFLLIGFKGVSWQVVLALVPILFFHECGHFLAMKAFGYRDLRMFFIPAFGAAVTGRHYNVPGWKKAVVSLMGPVPGIALGIIVGLCGIVWGSDLATMAGLLLLALNGFNLLPMLPLDGGHVVHTVLFSRHPALDIAFRVCAAGAIVALGALAGSTIFMVLAVVMLMSLPMMLRVSRAARDLRAEGLRAASEDDQTIPTPVAERIIARLAGPKPRPQNTKLLAQQTLQVFEALNARPPGVGASIGLLSAHAVSFVAAAVFSLVFLFAQRGTLGRFAAAAANRPAHALAGPSPHTPPAHGPAADAPGPRQTVVATFPSAADAVSGHAEAAARLGPGERAALFGNSLFITLPAADDEGRKRWLAQLEPRAGSVYVESESLRGYFRFQAMARTPAEAEAIEAELNEYFSLPLDGALAAPWSADAPPTAEHRLARRTYARLQEATGRAWDDPELASLRERILTSQRQGERAEVQSLMDSQQRLLRSIQHRRALALAGDASEPVDAELVRRYAALLESTEPEDFYAAAARDAAPLLGAAAPPPADATHALSGGVARVGPVIDLHYVSFADAPAGAAALTRWLAAKGCTGLRYEISAEAVYDEEWEEGWD